MGDDKKPPEKADSADWQRRPSGLFLPPGIPDGGKKPPVGFAQALEPRP